MGRFDRRNGNVVSAAPIRPHFQRSSLTSLSALCATLLLVMGKPSEAKRSSRTAIKVNSCLVELSGDAVNDYTHSVLARMIGMIVRFHSPVPLCRIPVPSRLDECPISTKNSCLPVLYFFYFFYRFGLNHRLPSGLIPSFSRRAR